MENLIIEATEELKRVDHLIYVSLKYTRTVDVLRNVIERLITTFDCIINGLLEKAENEGRIGEIPNSPMMKCNELRKIYPDENKLHEMIEFYLLLRKIIRAEFSRTTEFRRHVTMITHLEDKELNVDIDTVTEYYKKAKKYMRYLIEFLKE